MKWQVRNKHAWALESSKGGLLQASGNWFAPLIYRNRDLARRAVKEFREHNMKTKAVRIVMNATFEVLG